METTQQIMLFMAITVALCFGWYRKNQRESAAKDQIQHDYLKALKKLKGHPHDQKLRDQVIEKGSAYYVSIKKSHERLSQSDFDAIEYDIQEVLKNPKALKKL